VEVRPVWEVETPVEGEHACDELRAHGIKCDYTKMLLPSDLEGGPVWSLTGVDRPRLYVVVTDEDAERARAILRAWDSDDASD
jgi:hypothetical protein